MEDKKYIHTEWGDPDQKVPDLTDIIYQILPTDTPMEQLSVYTCPVCSKEVDPQFELGAYGNVFTHQKSDGYPRYVHVDCIKEYGDINE